MKSKKKQPRLDVIALTVILVAFLFTCILLIQLASCTSHDTPSSSQGESESLLPAIRTEPEATEKDTVPAETEPSKTQPVTAPVTEPVTEPTTEPVTEPVTEPLKPGPDLGELTYTQYNWYEAFNGTILTEREPASQEYLDSITFLGDSLTYGLKIYGVLSGGKNTTQVWFPKSGTICLNEVPDVKIYYPEDDEEITVREALKRKQPERLCISLGVNGISWLTEVTFKNEYRKILDTVLEVSPDTEMILQSIYPVGINYKSVRDINNKKISQANVWIAQLAQEYGIAYLNTAEILLDTNGFIKEEFVGSDALHMGPEAYQLVLKYILSHPYYKGQ